MSSNSKAVAAYSLKLHFVLSLQISGLVCPVPDVAVAGDLAADSKQSADSHDRQCICGCLTLSHTATVKADSLLHSSVDHMPLYICVSVVDQVAICCCRFGKVIKQEKFRGLCRGDLVICWVTFLKLQQQDALWSMTHTHTNSVRGAFKPKVAQQIKASQLHCCQMSSIRSNQLMQLLGGNCQGVHPNSISILLLAQSTGTGEAENFHAARPYA